MNSTHRTCRNMYGSTPTLTTHSTRTNTFQKSVHRLLGGELRDTWSIHTAQQACLGTMLGGDGRTCMMSDHRENLVYEQRESRTYIWFMNTFQKSVHRLLGG
jgi:hypothetical protein